MLPPIQTEYLPRLKCHRAPLDVHPTEFPEGRTTCPDDFLPNREMILWPFTNLTDGRYVFSEHYLRVSQDPAKPATKLGLKLATGWVAYQNGDYVVAKHLTYDPALPYPDRGSNFEIVTNLAFLELESLAPALPLPPGATRGHTEHWVLRKTTDDLGQEPLANAFFAALPKMDGWRS